MRRKCLFLVILMSMVLPVVAVAAKVELKPCRIGAHPVATDQKWDPETEFLVTVTEPTWLQMSDGRREVSACHLMPPYQVVASKKDGLWLRVLECSNPIVGTPIYTKRPATPAEPPVVEEPPAVPPITVAPPAVPPMEPQTPETPTVDTPATKLLFESFVGPTIWRIPWGDGYENVSFVNGIGIEGGVRIGGLHTIFGGLFAHRRPQSELLVADDCACWEDRSTRWPCLTAHFEHRAVDASWSWGAELGYRALVSRRLSVGPSIGHTDFGHGFAPASLVNTIGLGLTYDTIHAGMFSLGVYRVKRPALAETSQTVEVCWPGYDNACKEFTHTWPGQPGDTVTAVKAAWGWWF